MAHGLLLLAFGISFMADWVLPATASNEMSAGKQLGLSLHLHYWYKSEVSERAQCAAGRTQINCEITRRDDGHTSTQIVHELTNILMM